MCVIIVLFAEHTTDQEGCFHSEDSHQDYAMQHRVSYTHCLDLEHPSPVYLTRLLLFRHKSFILLRQELLGLEI